MQGMQEDEMEYSVAILAARDPAFSSAIQRRRPRESKGPSCLVGIVPTRAHLVGIVPTWVYGIVVCCCTAIIVLLGLLSWIMTSCLDFDPPVIHCANWARFLHEVRNYFGSDIPCPTTSAIYHLAADPQDRVPNLAWNLMRTWQGRRATTL